MRGPETTAMLIREFARTWPTLERSPQRFVA
jgi:hypothetical protein